MKKYLIFTTIISLSLFLFSCKDKDAFTIAGTITNPGSLKKIYLLAADTAQISVVDSTNLSDPLMPIFLNYAWGAAYLT
jgi:hypothetical protein